MPETLTPRSLKRLISGGESERLEFKAGRTSLEDIALAAVCFANADGGTILFGVQDDGAIDGTKLKNPDAIRKHIYHSTNPSQIARVEHVVIDGRTIAVVAVAHSPVIVSTTAGIYLQRLGRECVPMTPDRLLVRQINTRSIDFSSYLTPVPLARADELAVERFRRLIPPSTEPVGLSSLPVPSLLKSIGAAVEQQGTDLLTVAGLLLFGAEVDIRGTIPQHEVTYLRTMSGGTEYERRIHSSASILQLLDQLMTEIQAGTRTRRLRFGAQDLELPDYPERVIREAIVNAFAHRHYMLPGAVVIRQTSNFVEIENPGGFPEGITPDTAIRHAPVHRNRALCDLLDRVRLMERAGLGVDRIYEDQLRFGKLPPEYEGDHVALRLRIDSSTFDEPFARLIIDQERSGKSWMVEELLILSYVRRIGAADRATLARVGQLSEPESQEVISSLMSVDLLDRFGSGLATRYGLSAVIQERLGSAGKYTHERGLALEYQRSIILQHAAKFRRVDNRTVRDLLGISVGQAAKVLQALESRGDLVQIGSKRWAFYEVREPSLPLT